MADDIFCTVLHNVCITLYAKPLLVLQLVPVIIRFANIRPRQWLRLNNSFNRVNSLFSSARGYWPPHSVLFTSLLSTGGGFTRLVYQKFTQQQFDMRWLLSVYVLNVNVLLMFTIFFYTFTRPFLLPNCSRLHFPCPLLLCIWAVGSTNSNQKRMMDRII